MNVLIYVPKNKIFVDDPHNSALSSSQASDFLIGCQDQRAIAILMYIHSKSFALLLVDDHA